MPFPHTITRASAGSGKTFALSNRYLDLAHHGVPPERILATTFARKAAGEILDRILIRLAEAASDHTKRKELASFMRDGDALTQSRCRELLRQLAGSLHKLRVGTIDSFFAQVARSFALELGVPPSWRIAEQTEDEDLRDEAIEAVLAEHDRGELLQLVNLLTKGDAQRRLSGLLRDTVSDLYQVYLDASREAWEQLPRYKPLPDDELEATLEDLRTLPLDASALQKGRDQDYALAVNGDWKAFLSKGIAKCVLNGQSTYSRKQIEPRLQAVYQKLIDHSKAVLLGRTANFTIGARDFLSHFNQHYRRLKHRRRAILFDDVTRAVMQLSSTEGLAFRMDGQIDHLLLDEFQDTSPSQWTAIRPLAEHVTGGRRSQNESASFYCVGDVKQAIYGWRGGVAEIFATVEDQIGKMDQQTLAKSFRSSPVIIDTVNQVFANLATHTNLGRAEEAITEFAKGFPHHETAKTNLPGYAFLTTSPRDDDNQGRATLEFAARQIRELVEQAPGKSVGVLCRTNDTIAALIYELRELGIHASEEGGNPLTDSAAVQLILALLKLADHPGDTIARYHLATSVWGSRWKIKGRSDKQAALRISREVRQQLLQHGYGPAILSWADELSAECDAREHSRLKQLVELAYAYQSQASLRADDFIRVVQGQRIADPTAHPVRVTTIHRAKGLEFDIVVLPELDKNIAGQPNKFIVHRENETGPIDCIFEHVSQGLQPLLPARFQKMIADATRREVTETMCVLYVALTRAIHALHMIIPPSKENERTFPRTLSGLLRCTLKDTNALPPDSVVWKHGDAKWFEQLPVSDKGEEATKTKAEPLHIQLAAPLDEHVRSLDRVAPSRLHAAKTIDLAEVFASAENTYAKDRGSLIHACFEQIEWLDDGPPDRDALRQAVASLAMDSVDVERAIDDFFAMLELGGTRALLSRTRYASHSGEIRVRNEHDFAMLDKDRQIVQGSIDRLVLLYDGGRPVAADVIDFKTDADIAGAEDRHRDQLVAYRTAVGRIFKLSEDAITMRLLMVKEGTCIDI